MWGCWSCHPCCAVVFSCLHKPVNKSCPIKEKRKLSFHHSTLQFHRDFPKPHQTTKSYLPLFVLAKKSWLLSKIWLWTGACCEACWGIGQWKGLAHWIPVSAWNMPGLTSAVEKKRAGKKLWRSEGYFWLSMSSFLRNDLGRGLLAAFTVSSRVVVRIMQQSRRPSES